LAGRSRQAVRRAVRGRLAGAETLATAWSRSGDADWNISAAVQPTEIEAFFDSSAAGGPPGPAMSTARGYQVALRLFLTNVTLRARRDP